MSDGSPAPPLARRALFRLSGTEKHSPEVAHWLDSRADAIGTVARGAFRVLRDSGPDVREAMHDGCATACVDDAAFAYVGAYRSHVGLGFFDAAALPDSAGLLEGSGRFMRHVKLFDEADVASAALRALVAAAHDDCVARLAAARRDPA